MPHEFAQDPPRAPDPWADDVWLRTWLRRTLPTGARGRVEQDVDRFAARVATEAAPFGAEAEANPPVLVHHDAWGRRVDALTTSAGWQALAALSAQEGLVAIPYEQPGAAARLHQAAKLHMLAPVSAIYTCPIAMADGAARLIQVHGAGDAVLADAFGRLTSHDPEKAWVSGQWMTERGGGSDVVGGTRTTARRDGDSWRLTGRKWFASAADAAMAMALARAEEDNDLSVFFVPATAPGGEPNRIRLRRLKDKLGTRALPTAEIDLEDAWGHLVGERGRGVAQIAVLFNVTRIHNAVNAAAYMRAAVGLAQDYAGRRTAFGRPLREHPLHAETLAEMEADCATASVLSFRAFELQGLVEGGDEQALPLLRLLTPLAKLVTGKQAVATVSEAMEAIGGVAYLEESGFPRLLRDAQVLPIWEGTTNVLALDVLRALRDEVVFSEYEREVEECLDRSNADGLDEGVANVRLALDYVRDLVGAARPQANEDAQRRARRLSFSLGRTYAAALAHAHASWCVDQDMEPGRIVEDVRRMAQSVRLAGGF